MHSQTTHLIIFPGYSDKQSNMTMQELYTWGGNESLQQTYTTLTQTFYITIDAQCGSIMMLLMNSIHSNGSIKRGKDGVVSIWPADMFRACGL